MNIAFVGITTCGSNIDIHEVYEVALILRSAEHDDSEYQWMLPVSNLAHADPQALEETAFHERHPQGIGFIDEKDGRTSRIADQVTLKALDIFAKQFVALTRGALWVAVAPSFSEERIRRLVRSEGLLPAWVGVLIDPVVGATAKFGLLPQDTSGALKAAGVTEGFNTAIGDARWSRDLFDVIW